MVRLSLIIATCNRSAELLRTLRSVAAQDHPAAEWECIVVNNRSTDDTEEQFARFVKEHPALPLRMVQEPQPGVSHARNRGIAEAQGEYLAIIDDDERIVPHFIAAYIELFDRYPDAASAGGPIVAEYPAGRPRWMSRYTERPIANPLDLGSAVRLFPARRIPGGGNMALRRTTVERHGVFNPALGRNGEQLIGGEENDLFARLAAAGERCYYVPGAVMYHIIPESKCTDDYLRRLSFQIGRTHRLRAEMAGRTGRLFVAEAVKWGATLVLALGYLLSLRPAKGRYLIRMRREISKGIFQ